MSLLEKEMQLVLRSLKIPYQQEYRFRGLCGKRRWRFDFVLGDPDIGLKVAVEVEGGIWTGGRHSRGGHWFAADCEKYTQAALMSWNVLRYCAHQISTTAPAQLELMWEIYREDLARSQISTQQPNNKQARARQICKPRRSIKKKTE